MFPLFKCLLFRSPLYSNFSNQIYEILSYFRKVFSLICFICLFTQTYLLFCHKYAGIFWSEYMSLLDAIKFMTSDYNFFLNAHLEDRNKFAKKLQRGNNNFKWNLNNEHVRYSEHRHLASIWIVHYLNPVNTELV